MGESAVAAAVADEDMRGTSAVEAAVAEQKKDWGSGGG